MAGPQAQNLPPQQKTFTDTGGVFRFAYPPGFVLYQAKQPVEGSYIPVCQDPGLVCVVYPPGEYKGTNFSAAAFSAAEVGDARTESACFTFEALQTVVGPDGRRNQTPEISDKHPSEVIHGVEFKTGVTGNAGMSHSRGIDIFRTFHAGKCYEMDIIISQTSFGVYDPGTVRMFRQRDYQRVHDALRQILGTFTFLK